MADDIARLGIEVDTRDLDRGQARLRQFASTGDRTGRTVENAGQRIERSSRRAASAVDLLGGAFAAISVTQITRQVAQVESLDTRLLSLSGTTEQYARNLAFAQQNADRLGVTTRSVISSFSDLLGLQQSGLITQQRAESLTIGLINAQRALGLSSAEAGRVTFGLSQALSQGVVRAEEFNQVVEPIPGLLARMERAAGLGAGQLRQLQRDGQLTSETFSNLLVVALQDFEEQAAQAANTSAASFARINNSVDELLRALGPGTRIIAESIADIIDVVVDQLIPLVQTSITTLIGSLDQLRAGVRLTQGSIEALVQAGGNPLNEAFRATQQAALDLRFRILQNAGAHKTVTEEARLAALAFREEEAATFDFSAEIDRLLEQFNAQTDAIQAVVDGINSDIRAKSEASEAAIQQGEDIEALTESIIAGTRATEDGTVATRNQQRAIEQVRRRLDPTQAAFDTYHRTLRTISEANLSVEESTRLAGLALEELRGRVEENTDAAEPMGRAFEQAAERIDSAFQDAFAGAFDSFEDFRDSITGAFRQLLGQLVSQAAASGLSSLFGGTAAPGQGIGSVLLQGLTGGGGGSGGGISAGLSAANTLTTLVGSTGILGGAGLASGLGTAFTSGLSSTLAGGLTGIGTSVANAGALLTSGSLGGIVAGLGTALPLIGGALAIASLLSNNEPSNREGNATVGITTGQITQGGQTGDRFSQENRDRAQLFAESALGAVRALEQLSGQQSQTNFTIGTGDRDATFLATQNVNSNVVNEIARGSAEQVLETFAETFGRELGVNVDIFRPFAESGEALTDTISRSVAQYQIFEEALSAVDLELGLTGINAALATQQLAQSAGGFDQLIASVAQFEQDLRDRAQNINNLAIVTDQAFAALQQVVSGQVSAREEELNASIAAIDADYNERVAQLRANSSRLTASFTSQINAANQGISQLTSLASLLRETASGSLVETRQLRIERRRAAQETLARAASTGNFAGVEEAAATLGQDTTGLFGSAFEQQFDAAVTANALTDAANAADEQLTAQQQVIQQLERNRAAATAANDAFIARLTANRDEQRAEAQMAFEIDRMALEEQLQAAQEQINELRGINEGSLTIEQATRQFQESLEEERQARNDDRQAELVVKLEEVRDAIREGNQQQAAISGTIANNTGDAARAAQDTLRNSRQTG